MARRSFDDETLAWVREMPLSQVLDKLRDDGQLFWRRDPDFVPEKDKRTVRLFLSSPSGFAWEILVTGLKWFDVRAGKGCRMATRLRLCLRMALPGLFFIATILTRTARRKTRPQQPMDRSSKG